LLSISLRFPRTSSVHWVAIPPLLSDFFRLFQITVIRDFTSYIGTHCTINRSFVATIFLSAFALTIFFLSHFAIVLVLHSHCYLLF